jgi:hypothetical protein
MKLRKVALWSFGLLVVALLAAPIAEGRGGGFGGGGRGPGGAGGGRGGGPMSRPGAGSGGRGGNNTPGRDGNNKKEEQQRDRDAQRLARVAEARIEYAKRERQQSFDSESSASAASTLERILRGAAE